MKYHWPGRAFNKADIYGLEKLCHASFWSRFSVSHAPEEKEYGNSNQPLQSERSFVHGEVAIDFTLIRNNRQFDSNRGVTEAIRTGRTFTANAFPYTHMRTSAY